MNVTSRNDVTKLAQKYKANEPALFWYKLGTEHPEINAMKKAIDQKKPAMQVAVHEIGDLSSLRYKARREALAEPFYTSVIGQLYNITQIRNVYQKVEFYVISSPETNASMYPDGTCIIYSGLIDNAENMEEIVAVVAHEIAHFVLWHTINDMWRTAKAINRNRKWAEIGTVVAAGAYGASQIYSAQYGAQQSNAAQQQMYNNITSAGIRIREEVGLRTDVFTRLRYMRETESEADETAFWFLEKNGIDPIYLINFFKKLDAKTPSYFKQQKNNSKYSDHPDMSKRIETLEVMYKKYHIPLSNQISLPALSSFKPTTSSYNEKSIPKTAEINRDFLYMDMNGCAHLDPTCYSLKYIGVKNKVNVESIVEEPAFCRCVTDDLKREIRVNLSCPISFTSSSAQPTSKTNPNNDTSTDNRILYMDKSEIVHYDRTCELLKYNEYQSNVRLASLKEEPRFCRCVPDKLKSEIRINLSTPDFLTIPIIK